MGFYIFCDMRPHAVIAGTSGTHSVCVCAHIKPECKINDSRLRSQVQFLAPP